MNYYFINISERVNKFFADNWFDETIIKDNKDKVKPSANIISVIFIKKTIALILYL